MNSDKNNLKIEKDIKKGFSSYAILLTFIAIIFLYWIGILAMHYIYGFVSLFLLIIIYIISNQNKYLFRNKNIICLISSLTLVLTIIISHFILCNHPVKFYYKNINNGIEITDYKYKIINNYKKIEFEIPTYINDYEVKGIGKKAFFGSDDIYILKLPETIDYIEEEAFCNSSIKKLYLPNNIKYIGDRAFSNNYIEYLKMPSNINYVGEEAFSSINLFVIEDGAPIEKWNPNWNNINYSKVYLNSIDLVKINGIIYVLHNDKTATVSTIKNNDPKMIIVDKIIYNHEEYIVRTIDRGAGYGNWFEEIIIPNTVNKICAKAFAMNENLKKIYIPSSVIFVEENIFEGSQNVIIKVEHKEKPFNWNEHWNIENLEVYWNSFESN